MESELIVFFIFFKISEIKRTLEELQTKKKPSGGGENTVSMKLAPELGKSAFSFPPSLLEKVDLVKGAVLKKLCKRVSVCQFVS